VSPDGNGPQSASSTLPVVGQRPPERADAARNRQRVLEAAERLFAEHGVAGVTTDAVAAAAGVGKGTVFRRFGDKAGLAAAVLDERERHLQHLMLSGPPPLGPGAPAPARIEAFVRAYVDHLTRTLDVVRMSETASPGARYRIGSYRLWRAHLAALYAGPGALTRAEAVLGLLAAELVHDQRERGATWQQVADSAVDVAHDLL
jgi:AcrR family transcriptional regulator